VFFVVQKKTWKSAKPLRRIFRFAENVAGVAICFFPHFCYNGKFGLLSEFGSI
jgi:hypothetical protein